MASDWTPEKMERLAENVTQASLHSRDQSAVWQRWVMASCFSINAGAAIAVLNLPSNRIHDCSFLWSMAWFVSGLLASIAFGICLAIHLGKLSDYFQNSAWLIGNRSEDNSNSEKLDIEKFKQLRRQENHIFLVQFIGLICFVVGIAIAIAGLQ